MRQTITVKPNQSMEDVILMACGSIEGGMAFCALNNVAISDIPAAGTVYRVPVFDGNADGLIVDNSTEADTDVLQYLGRNGIVIGTLGTNALPPPPLGFTIILKPVMSASYTSTIDPITLGYYPIEYDGTVAFIAVNGLAAAYPGANNLYALNITAMYGGALPALLPETGHLPMTTKKLSYQAPCLGALGDVWVWNAGSSTPVMTFEDTAGNSAYYSPSVVLYDHSVGIEEFLVANMVIDFVSSDGYTATLRLTRSHPGTAHINLFPPYGHMVMVWLADALGGTPDPSDPLNIDKTIVTLTPGNYTLGVETSYVNDILHYAYISNSAFTMVITVA